MENIEKSCSTCGWYIIKGCVCTEEHHDCSSSNLRWKPIEKEEVKDKFEIAEEIFDTNAKQYMTQWNITNFRLTHPSLFNAIIQSIVFNKPENPELKAVQDLIGVQNEMQENKDILEAAKKYGKENEVVIAHGLYSTLGDRELGFFDGVKWYKEYIKTK